MQVLRFRGYPFFLVILLTLIPSCSSGASPASSPDDAPAAGRFDGPAELPRVYVKSAMADTPASGRVRTVQASDNLQDAIDSAKCGDTLKLQAGATFIGTFRLPGKSCDDSHWIVLRTSAPDESFPAESTRLTPCYAGVAGLPGRPDLHCSAVKNVMAKIEFDGKGGSGPLIFVDGANHYRFIGLEITRSNPGANISNLAAPQPGAIVHHLIFDRVWMHGTAQDETKGGLHLNGATYVAVIDSYFSDFHCIAAGGACTDAQTINGGGGDAPGGPYKIVNNFLEASGECILFGGSGGTTTPTDMEIRRNHLFKPMIWKPDQPGFVGAASGRPFIVKNHFELKNAQRVLFEGNILENNWGGFSQAGFSILLTPKNQYDKCRDCKVTDVTIRYNKISHVAGALMLANALSGAKVPSGGGGRYSIHDLVVDDISAEAYKGFGSFAIIESIMPPLKDIKIDHVTAFPPRVLISLLSATDLPKIANVTITNNILGAGKRQIASAGGGPQNCAFHQDPEGVMKNCFENATFSHNLIVGGGGGWPAGNMEAKDPAASGIRDFRENGGSDFHLCREKDEGRCSKPSPALRAGTDGKDLGADMDAIDKATVGVN